MGSKKKVNPRRIPVSKQDVKDALIEGAESMSSRISWK